MVLLHFGFLLLNFPKSSDNAALALFNKLRTPDPLGVDMERKGSEMRRFDPV